MADGTLKVGTITTSSGSGTITLGQSGETITIPSGATDTLTDSCFGVANTPSNKFLASWEFISGAKFLECTIVTTKLFNRFDSLRVFDTDGAY